MSSLFGSRLRGWRYDSIASESGFCEMLHCGSDRFKVTMQVTTVESRGVHAEAAFALSVVSPNLLNMSMQQFDQTASG